MIELRITKWIKNMTIPAMKQLYGFMALLVEHRTGNAVMCSIPVEAWGQLFEAWLALTIG